VSLGTVQYGIRRAQKQRQQQSLEHEQNRQRFDGFIEAVGGVDRDSNPLDPDLLELYRRAWHPHEPVTPAEQAKRIRQFGAAADAHWAARGRPAQDGGRLDDEMSWRAGVTVALSGDSGVDAADDW
jgi:hypothetical protein